MTKAEFMQINDVLLRYERSRKASDLITLRRLCYKSGSRVSVYKDGRVKVLFRHRNGVITEMGICASQPESVSSSIIRAPGSRLDALANFMFSKRTYEMVFKCAVADLQAEYFEALNASRTHKAKWIRIRGVICFWGTVALQCPVSLTRVAKKIWTISGG